MMRLWALTSYRFLFAEEAKKKKMLLRTTALLRLLLLLVVAQVAAGDPSIELSSFMVEGSALDTESLGVVLTKDAIRENDGIVHGTWPNDPNFVPMVVGGAASPPSGGPQAAQQTPNIVLPAPPQHPGVVTTTTTVAPTPQTCVTPHTRHLVADFCAAARKESTEAVEEHVEIDDVDVDPTYYPGIEEEMQALPATRSVAPEPSQKVLTQVGRLLSQIKSRRMRELYLQSLFTFGGREVIKLVEQKRRAEERATGRTAGAGGGALHHNEQAPSPPSPTGGMTALQSVVKTPLSAAAQAAMTMTAGFNTERRKSSGTVSPDRPASTYHDCVFQTNCLVRNLCLSPDGRNFIYVKNDHAIFHAAIHKTVSRRSEGALVPYVQMDFKRFRQAPKAFRFLFGNPFKAIHPYWPESRISELAGVSGNAWTHEMFSPLLHMEVWPKASKTAEESGGGADDRAKMLLPYPLYTTSGRLQTHVGDVAVSVNIVMQVDAEAVTTLSAALDVAWQIFTALARWGFLKRDYQELGNRLRKRARKKERSSEHDEQEDDSFYHPKVHVYLASGATAHRRSSPGRGATGNSNALRAYNVTAASSTAASRSSSRTASKNFESSDRNSELLRHVLLQTVATSVSSFDKELPRGRCFANTIIGWRHSAFSDPDLQWKYDQNMMLKHKVGVDSGMLVGFRNYVLDRLGLFRNSTFVDLLFRRKGMLQVQRAEEGRVTGISLVDKKRPKVVLFRNHRPQERAPGAAAAASSTSGNIANAEKIKSELLARFDPRGRKVGSKNSSGRGVGVVAGQHDKRHRTVQASSGPRPAEDAHALGQADLPLPFDFEIVPPLADDLTVTSEQQNESRAEQQQTHGHAAAAPAPSPAAAQHLQNEKNLLRTTILNSVEADLFIGYDPSQPFDFLFSPEHAALIAPWQVGHDRVERIFWIDRVYRHLPHRLITHYGVAITGREGFSSPGRGPPALGGGSSSFFSEHLSKPSPANMFSSLVSGGAAYGTGPNAIAPGTAGGQVGSRADELGVGSTAGKVQEAGMGLGKARRAALSNLVMTPSRKELGGLKGVILGHPYPFNITEGENFLLSGVAELGDYVAEALDFLLANKVTFASEQLPEQGGAPIGIGSHGPQLPFAREYHPVRSKNLVYHKPKQTPHQLAYLQRIFAGGDYQGVLNEVAKLTGKPMPEVAAIVKTKAVAPTDEAEKQAAVA